MTGRANGSATLVLSGTNGRRCFLRLGAPGPPAADIRKLCGEPGVFTCDPGCGAMASCESRITYIVPEKRRSAFRSVQGVALAKAAAGVGRRHAHDGTRKRVSDARARAGRTGGDASFGQARPARPRPTSASCMASRACSPTTRSTGPQPPAEAASPTSFRRSARALSEACKEWRWQKRPLAWPARRTWAAWRADDRGTKAWVRQPGYFAVLRRASARDRSTRNAGWGIRSSRATRSS